MAQKLHDTYGFSYDNLKVLLGGWNTWKDKNSTDATGYPVVMPTGATPAASNGNPVVVVAPGVVQVTPGAGGSGGAVPVVVTPKP
ncbi:MAG: hypothetical protein M3014_15500 [Chloroflexota bacterium]|nr:hypothetical protein [Chloroflexota bacterium]